jgi:DNA-binding NtrC family response regulator
LGEKKFYQRDRIMVNLNKHAKRILVVDDEKVIRDLLNDFLVEQGYRVVCIERGEDTLKTYLDEHIDIVLLDRKLRPMDGIEILSSLMKIDPEAIVIMITGYPSVKSATDAIKKGARDYIAKPFDLEELQFKLERVLLERSLQGKLKNIRGLVWALVFSIPVWLLLGQVLARFLK